MIFFSFQIMGIMLDFKAVNMGILLVVKALLEYLHHAGFKIFLQRFTKLTRQITLNN